MKENFTMNYQKIYNQLIEKRQIDKIQIKTYKQLYPLEPTPERHHIIPKSLGGLDEKNNLVVLTCREHFVAHQLLVKIAQQNNDKNALIKMTHALIRFYNGQQNKCKHISKNSHQYHYYKKLNKKIGISDSTRQLMIDNWKNRKQTPESKETRLKKSKSHIGYKHTEEAKKNMSIAQIKRYKRSGEIEKKRNKSKEVSNRPEIRKRLQKQAIEYWSNLSDEEYKDKCNAVSGDKNGMYGKHPIWLYNPQTKERLMLLDKTQIQSYLDKGFIRGSGVIPYNKGNCGQRKWISNDKLKISKCVLIKQLDQYLNNGWKIGRKYI